LFPPKPSQDELLYGIQTQCETRRIEQDRITLKRLGYNKLLRYEDFKGGYTNFFVHPGETIHFEYYVNLTDTLTTIGIIGLDMRF